MISSCAGQDLIMIRDTCNDIGCWENMSLTGYTLYTDSKGDTHVLQADGTTLDRLRTNIILNEIDITYFSNSSGVHMNLSSLDGTSIKVNIGGTQKNTGVSEYVVLLNNGTSETPVTNYVYLYNVTNPTIGNTNNLGNIAELDYVLLTRALVGNYSDTNYNIYSSSKENDLVQGFLNNINNRMYYDGLKYLEGFNPSISATELEISTGTYYNKLFELTTPSNLTMIDGAYYVNSAGEFITFKSLSDITEYSDTGSTIGNSKYYNLVWGITVENGGVRLIALIQKEPDTEYNSVDSAKSDDDFKLVSVPNIDILKYNYLPIARTIIQRNTDEFEVIVGSNRYMDMRGSASVVGGSAPTPSITDHGLLTGLVDDDHTQYLLQDGTESMTGNWDVGNVNVTFDTNTLHIDSTGDNVGVGTNSPATKLHVYDDSANAVVRFEAAGGTLNNPWDWGLNRNTGKFTLTDTVTGNVPIKISPGVNNNIMRLGHVGAGIVDFTNTLGTVQAVIDVDNGRVGIGTTTLYAPLHISGGAPSISFSSGDSAIFEKSSTSSIVLATSPKGTSTFKFQSSASTTHEGGIIYAHDPNRLSFMTNEVADRMVIDDSGNVGIGTDTPSASGVEVSRTGEGAQFYAVRTDGATMEFSAAGSIGVVGTRTDHSLKFRVNTQDAMIIETGSGYVGIGTDAPNDELDVIGAITSTDGYLSLYDGAGGTIISTSNTDITWDTEVREDSAFTHSPDSAEITINTGGDYIVTVDLSADSSDGSARLHGDWWVETDTGAGYSELAGTRGATYHRISSDGKDSASITRIITFDEGDKIKVVGVSDSASAITTLPNGCRITLRRI